MALVYLSLGSNMGDRAAHMSMALSELSGLLRNIGGSVLYECEAWGASPLPPFLNSVVRGETDLSPEDLLVKIKEIEKKCGRSEPLGVAQTEPVTYTSRPMDIDILLYDDLIMNTPSLVIPHPHLHERMFVLRPLAELTRETVHPILNKSIWQLLAECTDQSKTIFYHELPKY